MTEAEIRDEFPGTASCVYLNAAASSLLPRSVGDAIAAAVRRHVEQGILAWTDDMRRVEEARALAARLIGAAPADIAFVANTAEGVARIASGFPWRDGDEVVLADCEYPANVYPWAVQRDRGVRLRFVRAPGGVCTADMLAAALTARTRVLAVSLVQFSSGYLVDLEALGEACAARGVLLVVDAIQGLGVFPVDVERMRVGALAVDARKWLMGPAAAGFLYLSPGWAERITPRFAGAESVRNRHDMLQYRRHTTGGDLDLGPILRGGAGRHESGYYNVLGLTGLRAALELGERIGREHTRRQVRTVARRLEQGLAERGHHVLGVHREEERSGIVTWGVNGDAAEVHRRLSEAGFSLALREGRLRAAPHVYNTEQEIDSLLAELATVAGAPSRSSR